MLLFLWWWLGGCWWESWYEPGTAPHHHHAISSGSIQLWEPSPGNPDLCPLRWLSSFKLRLTLPLWVSSLALLFSLGDLSINSAPKFYVCFLSLDRKCNWLKLIHSYDFNPNYSVCESPYHHLFSDPSVSRLSKQKGDLLVSRIQFIASPLTWHFI